MNENTHNDGGLHKAAFSAGCFWGVEERFDAVPGVRSTAVGYMGGDTTNPSYEEVSDGKTGHAETVRVEYSPRITTYNDLLDVFWNAHDPTQVNRQGSDVGSQYRSIIFYFTGAQKEQAKASKDALNASGEYDKPIATEILDGRSFRFWKAEEYHQHYYKKNSDKPRVC